MIQTQQRGTRVRRLKEDLKWFGFQWAEERYASDYFQQLYEWAVMMIKKGTAYIDSQSSEDMASQKVLLSLVLMGRFVIVP
jgi:glutamyl/glutaminyl-tRNA synthetase